MDRIQENLFNIFLLYLWRLTGQSRHKRLVAVRFHLVHCTSRTDQEFDSDVDSRWYK